MSSQIETVQIDPLRVRAMHAALGMSGPPPTVGDALPHFWHWGQFWDIFSPDKLGRDGHSKVGDFIPDMGLPRRMWAGGTLEFRHPLVVGQTAERSSRIAQSTRKTGKTGPLAFVTVNHEMRMDGRLCVAEQQDLVYRQDPTPSDPKPVPPMAPTDETNRRRYEVTTTDLFRYSALTFNGHRIHYDLEYAQKIECYPGLIVHGPLLAQRMIELAQELLGGINQFSFRAVSPIFHFEAFEICAKSADSELDMWVRGPDGRLAMTGKAT